MGADDYISKPFSQRLVVERVKAVLRRFSPMDANTAAAQAAHVLERGKLRLLIFTFRNKERTRLARAVSPSSASAGCPVRS